MTKDKKESVFRPGGAQKLIKSIGSKLNEDEQALLLALIDADTELGEALDEEERAAWEKLREEIDGYDPDEVAQAVKHIITAKSKRGRKLKWPELKNLLRNRRPSTKK